MTRDPQAVRRDVRLGYYSAAQADALFGVVLDGDEVDEGATAARRGK